MRKKKCKNNYQLYNHFYLEKETDFDLVYGELFVINVYSLFAFWIKQFKNLYALNVLMYPE